jgi:alcohol dehydrogenase class IV
LATEVPLHIKNNSSKNLLRENRNINRGLKMVKAVEFPTDTVFTIAMTKVKFGFGVTSEVGYDLKVAGTLKGVKVNRALIVTDKRLVDLGLAEKVKGYIEEEGIKVDIFDGTHIEPTDESVMQAVEFAKGKQYDGYVGLGGGSSIDTAKMINLLLTHGGELLDYVAPPQGKGKPLPGPVKPMIALPTTAGTGSETSPAAVLDVLALKLKTGISHDFLRPDFGVVDPLNTVSMPPMVTASTGLDVLTHAMESFTNRPYNARPKPEHPSKRPVYVGSNPISDFWALKAIELCGKYLRRAVALGTDLEARFNMSLAATLAGVGFTTAGVHIPHSAAYPIGARVRDYRPPDYPSEEPIIPHGIAVSLTAPAVFKRTAASNPEKHLLMAKYLGVNVEGVSPNQAGEVIADALKSLMRDIKFPNGLQAVGYTEKDIPELAEGTLKIRRLLEHSPIPATKETITEILKDSLVIY